jgi:guanyl-specific ribonuclease Sa
MKGKIRFAALVALLLVLALVLGSCTADESVTGKRKQSNITPTPKVSITETPMPAETAVLTATPEVTEEPGPIIEPQAIADYLFEYGELPGNFITKQEAKNLGWDGYNYVSDVAPGMSIGGDYFGNYEGKLPRVKGRKYYEADCWYTGGKRKQYRIIYSNDGHVWYTEDHYNTFTEMSPSEP